MELTRKVEKLNASISCLQEETKGYNDNLITMMNSSRIRGAKRYAKNISTNLEILEQKEVERLLLKKSLKQSNIHTS